MGEDMCHTCSLGECVRKEDNTIAVRSEKGCWRGRLGSARHAAGRRAPAGVAPDEERWALGSVLGELGTGLFHVSGGSSQGVFGSHRTARELSRRTGRPAIYNSASQEIDNPGRWKAHHGG